MGQQRALSCTQQRTGRRMPRPLRPSSGPPRPPASCYCDTTARRSPRPAPRRPAPPRPLQALRARAGAACAGHHRLSAHGCRPLLAVAHAWAGPWHRAFALLLCLASRGEEAGDGAGTARAAERGSGAGSLHWAPAMASLRLPRACIDAGCLAALGSCADLAWPPCPPASLPQLAAPCAGRRHAVRGHLPRHELLPRGRAQHAGLCCAAHRVSCWLHRHRLHVAVPLHAGRSGATGVGPALLWKHPLL